MNTLNTLNTLNTRLAVGVPRDFHATRFQEAATTILLDAGEGTHTFRAYRRHLVSFLRWYDNQRDASGRLLPFSRALLTRWRASLVDQGMSASSINQGLAPIKRLAYELSMLDGSGISALDAASINDLKGVKQQGRRLGHWLTLDQAQALLDAPDVSTLRGLRDRAILAVFLGSGVRRDELEHLTAEHIQQRDGRWALVDVWGKHHRVRTIPIASWVFVALSEWLAPAGIASGPLFRAINKGGRIQYEIALSDQALRTIAKRYLIQLGHPAVAAHDLRRTFAKLAHKGGVPIEQIQLSLGHASIRTTEKYVGVDQDFTDAPSDHLGLRLGLG